MLDTVYLHSAVSAPMDMDFEDCLVLNTVKASRALTRRYDKVLKPFGVSVVQFTVLMTVRTASGKSMNRMAASISMDRTTLLRNLDLLVRRGLVDAQPVEKGFGREFALSQEGEALLDEITPLWHAAQDEMRARLQGEDPASFLNAMRALAAE